MEHELPLAQPIVPADSGRASVGLFNTLGPARLHSALEMPKYPQTESDFAPKGDTFQCAHCGKATSMHAHFTITASGFVDKAKTGGGRLDSPTDLAQLSLWYVPDLDLRRAIELPLSEGRSCGLANVICCSADCLKSYLEAAVDELVRRGAKT